MGDGKGPEPASMEVVVMVVERTRERGACTEEPLWTPL